MTDHRTRVGRERSARTEARIMEAALRVFAKKGPDAPVIGDFVRASGVSRGTFYNHFRSVGQLLEAASEQTTGQLLHAIEGALQGIDDPALRYGIGVRMFLRRAEEDLVWCRFVARVWKIGFLELPENELLVGLRRGLFRVPGIVAAKDFQSGALREALFRIASGEAPPGYRDEIAQLCLQALGVERRRIREALGRPLPVV
jgi:AcrR family transcriptional regulator